MNKIGYGVNIDSPKENRVYLIAAFILLVLPAFSALVTLQLGVASAWVSVMYSREVLWVLFGFIFVGTFSWQRRISGFSSPSIALMDSLLLLALLMLSIVLSLFVSLVPQIALYRTFILVLIFLVGYASYSLSIMASRKYSQAIYIAFLAGAVIHIPFVFLQIYIWQGVEDYPWKIGIYGWGGVRPYNYSVEVAITVGVGLLALQSKNAIKTRLILWLAISLCWMMLFWGGGRGAVMGILASLTVSSIIFPAYAKEIWKIAIFTSAVGLILSLFMWTPESKSFGIFRMISKSVSGSVSPGRAFLWGYALESIKERPLFGHGLEQFIYLQIPRVPVASNIYPHVHNIVLEVILSWGVLGAAIFTTLFARLSGRVLARLRALGGEEKLPALLALAALMAHSFVSGTYFHIYSLICLAVFFGICLAPNPAQNGNTNG